MKNQDFTPYIEFDRDEWAKLRSTAPMTMTEKEIEELKGLNDVLNLEEVEDIYLPLSRLLYLHAKATRELYDSRNTFLRTKIKKVPYIIGIAGSVAVGKSTMARVLKTLLSRWPKQPKVDLLTTDGFLYPNAVLEKRGIMDKKGFPESYDIGKLLEVLSELKSGKESVSAPIYSHITYDVINGKEQIIENPDILIVEGINVLQPPKRLDKKAVDQISVSDFFDFSIYVDAAEENIFQWYVERFKILKDTAFRHEHSYFKKFAGIDDKEAYEMAKSIWDTINKVNLHENILPTRYRSDLILSKGDHHLVESIKMRKI
ncbi:type I pantothenate kinase [Evansella cellulosilytica]|uniref:Pantothenate kinase n=1 Tax=Evansella cellulosilytica (strain ATCC 21833 / DSM 2522 / FERM P-1141 / JCM 9156 / N-4) TaxID=649639 RepID=E6TY75_EVAC2|nr:type I pantothenate kinase [Evansella cellulosilytica]ADU32394.1 pantothenate kinase [Evansella cellulosilytica DSM 2522]